MTGGAVAAASDGLLNVAATCRSTSALGPGRRAAVWVQGCPFDCAGCVSPEWIEDRPARFMAPEALAAELCSAPDVVGLTFSGGEPMLQAAGLARVIRTARCDRDLSLICFTGYRLEHLHRHPPNAGVLDLLAEVDVLIDGRYVAARDDNRGLRGSDNQRVHYLTDRLRGSGYDFENRRRSTEITITDGDIQLVGIPPRGLAAAFDEVGLRAHAAFRSVRLPDASTGSGYAVDDTAGSA